MDNNELLEVSNEDLVNPNLINEESPDEISKDEVRSPSEVVENDTSDKKSKKKKSQVVSAEVFSIGDRVVVDESRQPEWSDGSQIPHWIYTRRFYIVSISDDNTCEISLNPNGNISGSISSKFLNKVL